MAESQVREIRVSIDTKGDAQLKQISRSFGEMNKSLKQSTSAVTTLNRAFLTIQGFNIAGIGLQSIVSAADAMQKLTDRLKVSEGSTEGALNSLSKLVTVANSTKNSVEDTAVVYNRLNLSLRETGATTSQLLSLTQALQNSFRLSGSTASEATAATIQLSQGLASGQLRGQELRSVLEQNAVIGDILSKTLGKTRGELLKFAEKSGGIKASEVVKALADNFDTLNNTANKLTPTVGESLTVGLNKLKVSFNNLNQEYKGSEKLITVLNLLVDNIEPIAKTLIAIAGAYGTYTLAAYSATIATKAFTTALEVGAILKFFGVITTAGLAVTGLATALAGLAYIFYKFNPGVEEGTDNLNKWGSAADVYATKIGSMSKGTESFSKALEKQKALSGEYSLVLKANGELAQKNMELLTKGPKIEPSLQQVGLQYLADTMEKNKKIVFDFDKALASLNNELTRTGDVAKYDASLKRLKIQELTIKFREGKIANEEYQKTLREIELGTKKQNIDEMRLSLSQLNAEFQSGSEGQYALALSNINLKKMAEDAEIGVSNILDLNRAISENRIQEWNVRLASGAVTLREYRNVVPGEKINQLNAAFRAGKMDVYEYNQALVETSQKFLPGSALSVGLANYIKNAGTLSQNVATLITGTFQRLEDSLVEFSKTGKFVFRDFAQAVLDDLNRIIIRALIIRPIAEGILGSLPQGDGDGAGSGGAGSGGDSYSGGEKMYAGAIGGAFDKGVQKFATGGVVTRPTYFKFAKGNGVMGEAGPEGILPLRRTQSGDLGVQASGMGGGNVTVNIMNQSGAEITQEERSGANGEKILDILITSKVKEGLANGYYDKQFQQMYNLRRRGA